MNTEDHIAALRAWAKGMYPTEAATELLLRGFGGRFAEPGNPWIMTDEDLPWVEFSLIPENTGPLSGGERRYLAIAASLAAFSEHDTVILGDVVSGLDPKHLNLVLAAVAHAGGMTRLHPWP
jgi:hypothetical protein